MKLKLFSILSCLGLFACGSFAQTAVFIANHSETETGPFNAGRVRCNPTISGHQWSQWTNRGNSGLIGDGRVFHSFSRYKMYERNLLASLQDAGAITWTTGLMQKEVNNAIDPVNGGHDVDIYLALDPDGIFAPSGELPRWETAFDWANEFGNGYANTVYLGRVLQSEPPATAEEMNAAGDAIPVDSPAMRISYDITDTIKDWIGQGLLTESSAIAVGMVQRRAVISDGSGGAKLDDPELYVHSQMMFEVGNSHITTSAASGPDKGPGAFSDYDLVDGFVDATGWLGWTEVTHYPWSYVVDLGKYIWVDDSAGWMYIPK